MENKLHKRYGLLTAICMVVGIVIGSGVFFKAQDILVYTNGNVLYGILAWVIGGAVMIICSLNFANFATKYEKVNGLIDYSEMIVGKRYSYFVGWFTGVVYFPSLTAVLAWVSARYTLVLFGRSDITGGLCMSLACLYLILNFGINILSPKIAGKFQISSTFIKVIPLIIMGIVGTIIGLFNGNISEAIKSVSFDVSSNNGLFQAIIAAAFAYDGWIVATTINSELKNAKRNLPIALVLGTSIIMVLYIMYFIGLTGGASVDLLVDKGATEAFKSLFGGIGGAILNVFVVVSCLGTLNGLMIATTRSMYSLAIRGGGPNSSFFRQVDFKTNMPTNSGVLGLVITALWFFFFYASTFDNDVFGVFSFDSSELPIVTMYGLYIPIFVMFVIKEGKRNKVMNTLIPILGVIASLFMVFSAFYAHGYIPLRNSLDNNSFSFPILFYLIVFFIIMLIGLLFYKNDRFCKKRMD